MHHQKSKLFKCHTESPSFIAGSNKSSLHGEEANNSVTTGVVQCGVKVQSAARTSQRKSHTIAEVTPYSMESNCQAVLGGEI